MHNMTVLVVGSGGREHALVHALATDPDVAAVHAAPGNPGMAQEATCHEVGVGDLAGIVALAKQLSVDLVVVGPEAPLVAGLADALRGEGIATFGPSAAAAQLEGSKSFAKQVMQEAGVPTARAFTCTTAEEVAAALDELGAPYVVKDDGLAGGKGVVVTTDRAEAEAHAAACGRVVIEEYLDGPEVSLFAICDGVRALPLLPAQDFKRVGDDDEGPNTGGMGAYTPLPWAPDGMVDEIMSTVVQPTLDRMLERETPFQGLLYAGLALTSRGLRVVEFNARFGDPETQPILSMLQTGLGGVLWHAATGSLDLVGELEWRSGYAVGVVMAAEGYPASPAKGLSISIPQSDDIIHAGTAVKDGQLVSDGGRVLTVLGHGATLGEARSAAYDLVSEIDFPGGFWRSDIAEKAAAGEIRV